MIPFLEQEKIREYTDETLKEYERVRGKKIEFPIDPIDIFERLFGLTVIYDSEGVINQIDKGIIGCIYPDGHPSPWRGKDKVIVVNITRPESGKWEDCINDPTLRNENFTIAHEGMHYILHFLKGIMGAQYRKPIYCRAKDRYNPLEFQANAGAGELLMPKDKVEWLLDRQKPPAIIPLNTYERQLRKFFGASQGMIERRLTYLGYKLLNAKYKWADYTVQQKKQEEKLKKWIEAKQSAEKLMEEWDKISQRFSEKLRVPF